MSWGWGAQRENGEIQVREKAWEKSQPGGEAVPEHGKPETPITQESHIPSPKALPILSNHQSYQSQPAPTNQKVPRHQGSSYTVLG